MNWRDSNSLSSEEIQVALILLLEKAGLGQGAKNDLRFADSQVRNGDFDPRKRLERLLRETLLDREVKKDTPQSRP